MFNPRYTISPKIASDLIKIESLAQDIRHLSITPKMLEHLRETARLESIHYSTKIEGNRLTQEEVAQVILASKKIPGKERDEKEVLGYYAALDVVATWVKDNQAITENIIKTLHALVMSGGKKRVKPTPYRDGQNVIRESSIGSIVYLPPEAKDVPKLMKDLVAWIEQSKLKLIPTAVRAAVIHYQFATIHPYYDGNGRTVRLLATMTMHMGGYDLKGMYSLDEYYANDLQGYYDALEIGPSHNPSTDAQGVRWIGRAEADITSWLDYFCSGVAHSFERVKRQAVQAQKRGERDLSESLRNVDARQRKVIIHFGQRGTITAKDIEKLFKIAPRTARALCQQWLKEGFIAILNPAKKTREYLLKKM